MLAILLSSGIVLLDQATKAWIRRTFVLNGGIAILPGLFNLCYVENKGAAWGIFSGKSLFLIVFSVAMLSLIVLFRRKIFDPIPGGRICLGLLSGGIIGNLIDRVRFGHVVDFLDFHWRAHHFPAFNVADSAICIATGLFLAGTLLADRREKARKAEGAEAPNPPGDAGN
jgi:signal peptidase II